MGGQACVLYGGAEFSRDTDIVILSSPENMRRLWNAIADLDAVCIAVPPFHPEYLDRGHAVHFRCARDDVKNMRLDVMTRMRGVDPFRHLWERRTIIEIPGAAPLHLLSMPDLVQAKKTQRDKDWLMIRNLLEASYCQGRANPSGAHVDFWLKEMRTPEHLCEVAKAHPAAARLATPLRPLLEQAMAGDHAEVARLLVGEEQAEREKDRAYWLPLLKELESIRRGHGEDEQESLSP
jgi:hypothetical protein